MKKTLTIIVIILSVCLLGSWVYATEQHKDQVVVEKFIPTQQVLEKAQSLIKAKFPNESRDLKQVNSSDDITFKSDSAVFSLTKDASKIKNIEFRNVKFSGKKIIDESKALIIAESFIKKNFTEINLQNYKSEVQYFDSYNVKFVGFDYKTGVKLANKISVYINPETGDVAGIGINDNPNPPSIDVKISKDEAYKLAIQKLTLADAYLKYSFGPEVMPDPETKVPVVGYSFVFKNSSDKELIVVNGTTGKVNLVDYGW